MIGFFSAIILFNFIAFTTNKRLTKNQFIHIWIFTIAVQAVVETFLDFKYHGYWYFTKEINWFVLPALTILIPPVSIIFISWYPFKQAIFKQILYFVSWVLAIILYERITLLPEPWGYFRYGWWRIWYSFFVYPVLLFILLWFYKWIVKIEQVKNV